MHRPLNPKPHTHTAFMLKILDRYIIGKYLGTFVFAIFLFIAISVAIDLSERIDDFLEYKISFYDAVVRYYGNFIPFIVFLLSPIFVFIAVIFFTAQLANRSEVIAIISGGVSFYRLLFIPYFVSATVLVIIQLYGNHFWVPRANANQVAFQAEKMNKKYTLKDRNVHLQISPDTYIYVETYNNNDSTGRRFTLETRSGRQLVRKIAADKLTWLNDRQQWRLENYIDRRIDSLSEQLRKGATLDTTLALTPQDFDRRIGQKESMTTPELRRYITNEIRKGAPMIEFYQVELHRRTAIPFATYILTTIGLAIASRRVRGGLGWHIAVGMGLSALYVLFLQFSMTFATNGGLSPLLSVWLPNFAFGLLSVLLVWKAQK
ncbi:MAG: LptF/LptG family permease [Chitinophagales bacterium]|nr:LptF/LptG family permease [Chitinophagales bacterium]